MSSENLTKVVLTIPSSELESLRSFINQSDGQIIKESRVRKRKHDDNDEVGTESIDVTPDKRESSYTLGAISSGVELGRNTGREDEEEAGCSRRCEFCLQNPCVTTSNNHRATFLSAYGPPRPQNISKRFRDYKEYYKMLKKERLWHNPLYINRKHELGIFIDDVREVLPNCVVGDVRKRWPNPPDIPYKGHVPTMTVT